MMMMISKPALYMAYHHLTEPAHWATPVFRIGVFIVGQLLEIHTLSWTGVRNDLLFQNVVTRLVQCYSFFASFFSSSSPLWIIVILCHYPVPSPFFPRLVYLAAYWLGEGEEPKEPRQKDRGGECW